MIFTISKDFHFSASHKLHGLPDGHQCGRLHGHNYTLTIILTASKLSAAGFVQDYGDLTVVGDFVNTMLDHRHLNDVFDFNTTVENMSRHIYELFKPVFPLLKAVEMSETPKTKCRYEGI